MILSDCNTLNSVCIELFLYNVNIYAETFTWNNESLSSTRPSLKDGKCIINRVGYIWHLPLIIE